MPVSISTPTPIAKTQCVFYTDAWDNLERTEKAVYCSTLEGVVKWILSKVHGVKEKVQMNFDVMRYESYLVGDLQGSRTQATVVSYLEEIDDCEEDHSKFQITGLGLFEDSAEVVEFRITPHFDRLVLETPTQRFTACHGDYRFKKLGEVFAVTEYLLGKRVYDRTLEVGLPGATDEDLEALDRVVQLMATEHKTWPIKLRIKR